MMMAPSAPVIMAIVVAPFSIINPQGRRASPVSE
jgi:hypothetical protein